MDDVVDDPTRHIYVLEQRIVRLRQTLEEIVLASRDDGLSAMVLFMRNRAYRALEVDSRA